MKSLVCLLMVVFSFYSNANEFKCKGSDGSRSISINVKGRLFSVISGAKSFNTEISYIVYSALGRDYQVSGDGTRATLIENRGVGHLANRKSMDFVCKNNTCKGKGLEFTLQYESSHLYPIMLITQTEDLPRSLGIGLPGSNIRTLPAVRYITGAQTGLVLISPSEGYFSSKNIAGGEIKKLKVNCE